MLAAVIVFEIIALILAIKIIKEYEKVANMD
jgi:hypothetical protein